MKTFSITKIVEEQSSESPGDENQDKIIVEIQEERKWFRWTWL